MVPRAPRSRWSRAARHAGLPRDGPGGGPHPRLQPWPLPSALAAASSTVPVVGVFNGCMYTDPTTKEQIFSNYYPASTNASDIIAFIVDDPNVVFEVQSDDTFPVADLFGNFDIIDTNSGSTTTGISGVELDLSTGATTTTLPLKAIDISQDPDNSDVSTSNTNVMVVIQNHIAGVKGAGLA